MKKAKFLGTIAFDVLQSIATKNGDGPSDHVTISESVHVSLSIHGFAMIKHDEDKLILLNICKSMYT